MNDKERLAKSPEVEEKQERATEKSETEAVESDVKNTLGTLQFTVAYDVDKSTLTVSVICAKSLPIKNDTIGTSDPYVKLQLLPDKRQKVTNRPSASIKITPVICHSWLNPRDAV